MLARFFRLTAAWVWPSAILVPVLVAGTFIYPSVRDAVLRHDGWVIAVAPDDIDIVLPPGSAGATVAVRIRNLQGDPIRLEGVQVSCACVSPTSELPVALAAGEERDVAFRVDQAADDWASRVQEARFFVDRPSPPVKVNFRISRASPERSGS
jgi:hypothetical protein